MSKKKIAVIGTGGTISSIGRNPFDIQDYITLGKMMNAAEMVEFFADVATLADLVPISFPPMPSTAIAFDEYVMILERIDAVTADPEVAGVVILHGTATLEETAYALNLTAKTEVPIVLTGAQRPASGLSTDGAMNFANAVRVAASQEARGMGVLTLLNDEIQCAREVTKTSTWRMQTFRTPDFGALGHADADRISFYRRPMRPGAPNGPFDIEALKKVPRVDVSYAYAGCDGTAVRAFVAAGAKGIVSAGFGPGFVPPAEHEALAEAVKAGVTVVQSSRTGSGRAAIVTRQREAGLIGGDNLNPQKARILLALALTKTSDPEAIADLFATY
ncbi:asparaginase [Acuticoccus mangrovi]|uniref:Asparaginase n=1 Tax=Acuticoccus mangrovi TaxID=2796142 RepID=A0A934MH56_9HYPH|nr:asparaginase [Acuticoccus mangrovi]MBJ3777298.1 asparaginase [Acuticoccus mangrovi]